MPTPYDAAYTVLLDKAKVGLLVGSDREHKLGLAAAIEGYLRGVADTEARYEALVVAFKAESDALFDILRAIKRELDSRHWIFEGHGPYQWDDDQYKEEAGRAFESISDVLEKAAKSGRGRYDAVLAALEAQKP